MDSRVEEVSYVVLDTNSCGGGGGGGGKTCGFKSLFYIVHALRLHQN